MSDLDIFTEALTRTDPADRAAFLDRACGPDAELRVRIDDLLARHASDNSLLDHSPTDILRDVVADTVTRGADGHGDWDATVAVGGRGPASTRRADSGTVIAGRYTLREVIGEGGMGSVYLAEQTEPVKRRVALKLVKTGMDSKTVLARFDAERQALAMMDHPNIARIYDGGVTPAGQPFFVMELVQGVPLTEYCDAHRLTVDARLQLFVAVCQAVQHAHQKGVIHRDLKPGNVLVTEVDGRPTPKVIDFGVAKATEQKLTDQSYADTGAIVGTPAYMSPEQADPTSMDIDTRSDVYALGVMLYELLTGSPPIDKSKFQRGAILEMLRMVREVEPPRPSTKLSTADALPKIAADRDIDPAKLTKLLRGELDWVVMKALEKDRGRRYDSANGLARDVGRYLADEVVEARPPTRGYRLQKFVRRNKGQVVAASLVLVSLVAGMVGTTWGLYEAQQQAEHARKESEEKEMARQAEAARANELQQVATFQAKMIGRVDATEAGKRLLADLRAKYAAAVNQPNVPAADRANRVAEFDRALSRINATDAAIDSLDRTILTPSVAAIADQFADQPRIAAWLRNTLGEVYRDLGRFAAARPLFDKALADRRAVLGDDDPATVAAVVNAGQIRVLQGQFNEAEPLVREAVATRKKTLGDDHADTLSAMNDLGYLCGLQGKRPEAEGIYQECYEKRLRVFGTDHRATLTSMNNLANLLLDQKRYVEAEPLFVEALAVSRRMLGDDDRDTMQSINNLGLLYLSQKKLDLAEPLLREAYDRRRRVLGEDHPSTLTCVINYGIVLRDRGKLDDAEAFFRRAVELGRRTLGTEHAKTQAALSQLAKLLQSRDKPAEAEPLLREMVEGLDRSPGKSHWRAGDGRLALGRLLLMLKRYTDVEPLLLDAERVLAKGVGVPPGRHQESIDALIEFYTATNKPGETRKWQAERARYPAAAPPPPEKK